MGCVVSSPRTSEIEAPHHRHPVEAQDSSGDGAATSAKRAAELPRGGGKGVDKAVAESSRRALRQILGGRHRDWLLDASGTRVKIDSMKGAPVGILFTAQTIPQGRRFQKVLLAVQEELRAEGRPFEVVMVSNDETEELWKSSIAETTWLAVPFRDHPTIDGIGTRFEIGELPTLVLLDREGNFVTKEGIQVVSKFGASAWPFTADKIQLAKGAKLGGES